jgi:hypothetical protein
MIGKNGRACKDRGYAAAGLGGAVFAFVAPAGFTGGVAGGRENTRTQLRPLRLAL